MIKNIISKIKFFIFKYKLLHCMHEICNVDVSDKKIFMNQKTYDAYCEVMCGLNNVVISDFVKDGQIVIQNNKINESISWEW